MYHAKWVIECSIHFSEQCNTREVFAAEDYLGKVSDISIKKYANIFASSYANELLELASPGNAILVICMN